MLLRTGLAMSAMSMMLAPLAAQQRFDELAPEKSFLVVGAPNMGTMMDHIQNGPMGDIWNQPEIQELVQGFKDQFEQMIREAADNMQVEEDAFTYPTGSVGMAMFLAMDEDLGIELPAMFAYADFGEDMAKVQPIFEKALEALRMEGRIEEEREVLGRTVYTFK